MEENFKEELENFCADVLGDFMELRAYEIEDLGKYGIGVMIKYSGLVYAPMEVIRADWKEKTKGTKFESVQLWA